MQIKKFIIALCGLSVLYGLQSCNRQAAGTQTTSSLAAFEVLPESDPDYHYIKNYFILSEQRDQEKWYSTYLNKCRQFYKVGAPTKDSIFNLIKSYWVTSDQQKHEILSIQRRPMRRGSEIHVTMNYSYRIIAENRVRQIPKLKLQMILNRQSKVISIKELSRG